MLMSNQVSVQHFILTRFNLLLWNRDKEGQKVRSKEWLEHRFYLFEKYCLPSIIGQTCQSFEWIVLFDSTTPEKFKERIVEYQKKCPQLIPVYVRPERGRLFAQIFKDEVVKRVQGVQAIQKVQDSSRICELENPGSQLKVLTTYLDNDDALHVHFVEDIQRRAASLPDETFITYDSGYQFFTDHNYVMRIHFPRNHFMSVVESGESSMLKTIYGYGSHYYIEIIDGAKVEHVKNLPMWCEVIHEKNMGNDAYFLNARMIGDGDLLRREFSLNEKLQSGTGLYLFRFLPRYLKTFVKRIGYFFFGRHW